MDWVWLIFVFIVGSCVGSFLNVVIYRLPLGQSIVFPSSHCPRCGRAIRWYDNIPLLSWLVLRARCRFCKAPISSRYPLIELSTALLAAGLYAAYFMLDLRTGVGSFTNDWPMFVAHAVLLAGLLACSAVDVEHWIVPLEVCWFVALVGAASATAAPHPIMPMVSPVIGAAAVGTLVGLVVGLLMRRYGLIQDSFIDARERVELEPPKKGKPDQPGRIKAVAFTKAHGVNPRREMLRELTLLLPAIVLGVVAVVLVLKVAPVGAWWNSLLSAREHPRLAGHLRGGLSSAWGFIVGGGLVWLVRILGTLAFGKEAMGRGDVHIMCAVGAVTGWLVPVLAFFIAPFFGLLWALYLLAGRNQRELPYGPWLAVGTAVVMIFHDGLVDFLGFYSQIVAGR